MSYFIEYKNIPYRFNSLQTLETNDISLFVFLKSENRLGFTDYAKRNLNISNYGADILRIYQENIEANEIQVLFEYHKHFGEKLSNILRAAPREILV